MFWRSNPYICPLYFHEGGERMIRVMLVDDEPFIRVAIKNLFNWEEHGFQIVSEANNGEAGILKLKYNQPDLIITDMKMPITNGIELIKYVKKHYSQIKCVVLSNYDDFELTRSAFIEGAVDYLLKNDLNSDNFSALTSRLKKNFFVTASDSTINIPEGKPLPFNQFDNKVSALQSIIKGCKDAGQSIQILDEKLSYVICKISLNLASVPSYSTDSSGVNFNLIKSTVLKIISEISEFKDYYYSDTLDQYVLMVYNNEPSLSVFFEKLESFFQSLCSNIQMYLNAAATIGVSEIKTNTADLPSAYEQASLKAQNLFYDDKSMIYFSHKTLKPSQEVSRLVSDLLKKLSQFVNEKNWDYVTELFFRLCNLMKAEKYPPQKVRRLVINLIFLLQEEVMRQQADDQNPFPENEALFDQILQARKMTDLESCIQQFLTQFKEKSDHWETTLNNYSIIVDQALQYLHHNFQDPNVNLSTVAKAISVNQSYLSRIFFKETQKHFNAYLTNLRLSASKNFLLTTKESISMIAEKCGYSNSKYYSNLFKRTEGITPNTYRNQIRNNGKTRPEDWL